MRGTPAVIEVPFGSGHKERGVLCKPMEASKVHVSTVHDVERGRFENQLIQEGDVVNFPMSDADDARNRASQIHFGMELDSPFVLPKRGPWKKGETQIDCRGIQGISRLVELQSEILVRIQLSGYLDQHLSKVGVDMPIPFFVGVGQCASRDSASNPCVIKLGLHGPQACFDIAKTLPVSQLSEGHAQKLIEARKVPNSVLALIPANALGEFVSRKKTH